MSTAVNPKPFEARLKSCVGSWKFNWKTIPRGREGAVEVEIKKGEVTHFVGEVQWRRDSDGIWIQLPHGTFGYDLKSERDDSGELSYSVAQRMGDGEWVGISTRGEETNIAGSRAAKAKAVRVRAQMPGKIIRILIQANQIVQKDQPLVLMEAMKMENEIRAPQAGKITQLKIVEGQAVETGADLLYIEACDSNEN